MFEKYSIIISWLIMRSPRLSKQDRVKRSILPLYFQSKLRRASSYILASIGVEIAYTSYYVVFNIIYAPY